MYRESDLLKRVTEEQKEKMPILLKCIFPSLPRNIFINLYNK